MKLLKITSIAAILASAFISFSASADWVNASGVGRNRDEAVNNAIYNIMLQTGSDMNKVQRYSNGELQRNGLGGASNPIKKIVITETESTLNKTRVQIKAFINDRQAKVRCTGSRISKTILPLSFKYLDSAAFQGANGIENLNKEFDRFLSEDLKNAAIFNLKPILNLNVINDNGKNASESHKLANLESISRRYGSQYLIIGTINSLSKSKVGDSIITNMLFVPTRSIDFDVDIYDAINQQIIFHKNYAAETDWPFANNEFIDVRSDRFRGSDYGLRFKELMSNVSRDLVGKLQCAPVSAKVIDIAGDDLIINIGADNGLTKGMKFSLAQSSMMPSDIVEDYEVRESGKGTYKVVSVYPHSAKLKPEDLQNNTLNISVNDIVSLL